MQLEWGGSMSGTIDSVADVPLAWDFSVSVSDQAQPLVSTDVYFEVSHQAYLVGGFNQGGYAYSTSVIGPGHFTSPANLRLNWPGPPPHTPRSFTSYYVRMIVLYANSDATTPTTETLSIDIPSATSLDLGDVRRRVVPEPATWGLIAAGLAGVAWRKRAAAR
ncbi:MAG: PEP-CTERM sorting domain-containing protein [Acidobacteria bacterium]|nr:PEP-CTERM sorting domain-containing protein [Acidobacteriota bacterium]